MTTQTSRPPFAPGAQGQPAGQAAPQPPAITKYLSPSLHPPAYSPHSRASTARSRRTVVCGMSVGLESSGPAGETRQLRLRHSVPGPNPSQIPA